MPLESATYIPDLNVNNPTQGDQMGQGDDHLRLIKSALKATLPNLAGPMTVDHTTLNGLPGGLAAEAAARGAQDAALAAGLNTEATTRASVDQALRNAVDGLSGNLAGAHTTNYGWQLFPSGVTMQWGRTNTGSSGVVVTFPVPYATECSSVIVTQEANLNANVVNTYVLSHLRNGFAANSMSPVDGSQVSNIPFSWVAFGF